MMEEAGSVQFAGRLQMELRPVVGMIQVINALRFQACGRLAGTPLALEAVPNTEPEAAERNQPKMNTLNSLAFAAIGSLMEILPRAFPAWFPPTNADQSSSRALWLDLMGAVQITLGIGFVVRTHFIPIVARLLSATPDGGHGALVLTRPRAAGR
jgi:hypothetical protein